MIKKVFLIMLWTLLLLCRDTRQELSVGVFCCQHRIPWRNCHGKANQVTVLFLTHLQVCYDFQNPHIDYPYWDLASQPENWPGIMKGKSNSGFPFYLNMQVCKRGPHSTSFKMLSPFSQAIVMLDNFTIENGATAMRPGSHLQPGPFNATQFFEDYVQIEGKVKYNF